MSSWKRYEITNEKTTSSSCLCSQAFLLSSLASYGTLQEFKETGHWETLALVLVFFEHIKYSRQWVTNFPKLTKFVEIKTLRYALHFRLSSRCLEMWPNRRDLSS